MSNNKWIPLDGKKEPPFKTKVVAWTKEDKWEECWLDEIKTTENGKQYVFSPENSDIDRTIRNATHYMIPSSPNEVKNKK